MANFATALTPQTISQQYPLLVPPTSIDYVSKDWASLTASMLAYAQQAMPAWQPTSEGDFGIMLVELMAYMGDILSYYGDRASQEAYLPTATQLLSVLNIAATLGYAPYGPVPASGTVTFTTPSGGPSIDIPVGTQLTTGTTPAGATAPPIYQTNYDVTCAGNGGTVTVPVTQGETFTMVSIGTSTGNPGQSYQIPQIGAQQDTIQVYVQSADPNNPTLWTQIPFIVDAGDDDTDYSVSTDSNGITWINFGDNTNGVIPGINLSIYATYNVIVGAAGNLPASQVDAIVDPISGVTIATLADGLTPDTSAMTGGSDAEGIESIRQNASSAFTAQYRAVSLQDFTDAAYNVPGVVMANAVGSNATNVTLYVAGPNYQAPSVDLVNNIYDYFDDTALVGVSLNVANPAIILVNIGTVANPVQITIKDGYSQGTATTSINTALTALLSPPNVQFAQQLNVSDIYEAIMNVDGVLYCIVPVFTREDTPQTGTASIKFRDNEFMNAGLIELSVTGGFL